VRELQNAIQFAFVKCDGNVIGIEHLPLELREAADVCGHRGPVRKLELGVVRKALARTGGNKVKAAKLMGVGRATLYRFLNDHPEIA
jgi:transcriptional regulator of acetoin/glycerol metabolism